MKSLNIPLKIYDFFCLDLKVLKNAGLLRVKGLTTCYCAQIRPDVGMHYSLHTGNVCSKKCHFVMDNCS